MRLYINPNAQALGTDIVGAATAVANAHPDHPVYCCVRRYQSWLQSDLSHCGYALCRSQAVLVRHIANPREKKAGELSAMLHTQPVHPTTMLEGLARPQRVP